MYKLLHISYEGGNDGGMHKCISKKISDLCKFHNTYYSKFSQIFMLGLIELYCKCCRFFNSPLYRTKKVFKNNFSEKIQMSNIWAAKYILYKF